MFPGATEWQRLVAITYGMRSQQADIQALVDAAATFEAASLAARDFAWEFRAQPFGPDGGKHPRVVAAEKRFAKAQARTERLRHSRDSVGDILNGPSLSPLLSRKIAGLASLEEHGLTYRRIGDVLSGYAAEGVAAARGRRSGKKGALPDAAAHALLDYATAKDIGLREMVKQLVEAMATLATRHGFEPPSEEAVDELKHRWEEQLKSKKYRRSQRR